MWMYFLKGLINTRRLYPEFTAPLDSSSDRKRSECLSFVTSATDILSWHKNTVSLAFLRGLKVSRNPEVLQNQTDTGVQTTTFRVFNLYYVNQSHKYLCTRLICQFCPSREPTLIQVVCRRNVIEYSFIAVSSEAKPSISEGDFLRCRM